MFGPWLYLMNKNDVWQQTKTPEQRKCSGGRRNILDQNKSVQQGRESEKYDETR
jgi:hypothetical protein